MKALIINDDLKGKWEQFVYDNPDTIAWQSNEWSNVLHRHYKFDYLPIAAYDGTDIHGILPLYRIKTIFARDVLISVPYAVAGGITAGSDAIKNLLLEKAIEISKEYNSCKIILKQYKVRISGNLQTDDNYYNRELELSKNIDELWNGMSDINRGKIKEADKFNLILEYPSGEINSFYELLLHHHHTTGLPCVSKKWIESLISSKMYSIAIMKLNDRIVAGTMIKKFKKTVSFPFTCTVDRSEKSILFAYSMYWHLIQGFASEGYEIFHSGRIAKKNLTYDYRLGWGGTKYNYYYQYYPASVAGTEYSSRRGRKRELFESCWKHLPQVMAGKVGPYIVKHFP